MLSWYLPPMSSWQDAHWTRATFGSCGSSAFARSAWQSTHESGPCIDALSGLVLSWQVRQSSLVGPGAAATDAHIVRKATAHERPKRTDIASSRSQALLLQRAQVRHERIHVFFGQRVRLHLRLPRRLHLRGHAFRVGDPLADFGRRNLGGDAVERALLVALFTD